MSIVGLTSKSNAALPQSALSTRTWEVCGGVGGASGIILHPRTYLEFVPGTSTRYKQHGSSPIFTAMPAATCSNVQQRAALAPVAAGSACGCGNPQPHQVQGSGRGGSTSSGGGSKTLGPTKLAGSDRFLMLSICRRYSKKNMISIHNL